MSHKWNKVVVQGDEKLRWVDQFCEYCGVDKKFAGDEEECPDYEDNSVDLMLDAIKRQYA